MIRAIRDRVKYPYPDFTKPYVPDPDIERKAKEFKERLLSLDSKAALIVYEEAWHYGLEEDRKSHEQLLSLGREILDKCDISRVEQIVEMTKSDGVWFAWESWFEHATQYLGRHLLNMPPSWEIPNWARSIMYSMSACDLFPEEMFDLVEKNLVSH